MLHSELVKVSSGIITQAKYFYLAERQNLLKAIGTLLRLLSRQQGVSNVRDKLVRRDLAKNLSKSLLRCIQRGDYHEFRRFFDSDSS